MIYYGYAGRLRSSQQGQSRSRCTAMGPCDPGELQHVLDASVLCRQMPTASQMPMFLRIDAFPRCCSICQALLQKRLICRCLSAGISRLQAASRADAENKSSVNQGPYVPSLQMLAMSKASEAHMPRMYGFHV